MADIDSSSNSSNKRKRDPEEDDDKGEKKEKHSKEEGELSFQIHFLEMGQGDCCLIKCPDGKFIVVDCGSSAGMEAKMLKASRNRVVSKVRPKVIEALILTHPDKDHYNQVAKILKGFTIRHIYFSQSSDPSKKRYPLSNYSQSGMASAVQNGLFKKPNLHEVTINAGEQIKRSWDVKGEPIGSGETAITGNKLIVHSNAEKKWAVSIIAGNVSAEAKSEAEIRNSASLVTLIELDGKKALLCGDATRPTQNFIFSTHKAAIKDLSIFQIPHHGSAECTCSDEFTSWVDPQEIVVSVAYMEHAHCLPRENAVKGFLATPRLAKDVEHHIDYWREATKEEVDETFKGWHENVNTKNVIDPSPKTRSTYYFLLKEKTDANGDWGVKKRTTKGYIHHRHKIAKSMFFTAQGPIHLELK